MFCVVTEAWQLISVAAIQANSASPLQSGLNSTQPFIQRALFGALVCDELLWAQSICVSSNRKYSLQIELIVTVSLNNTTFRYFNFFLVSLCDPSSSLSVF